MKSTFPTSDEEIRSLRLSLLRDLAAVQYPKEAIAPLAAKHRLTVDDVKSLVQTHGWPDPGAMARSAAAIERNGNGAVPAKPSAPSPPSLQPTNVIEALLVAAENSPKASTKKAATRIRQQLAKLRDQVVAERKAREAAKAAAAEKERLRNEVKELEAQLAAKRAALRPKAAPRPNQERVVVTNKNSVIRAWAAEHGIDCEGHGRIPRLVVEAYDAAHPEVAG